MGADRSSGLACSATDFGSGSIDLQRGVATGTTVYPWSVITLE